MISQVGRSAISTESALIKTIELSEVLMGSDRQKTIEAVLEKTAIIFPECRICFISLQKGKLVVEKGVPFEGHGIGIIPLKKGGLFLKNVIDAGQVVVVNDPLRDNNLDFLKPIIERYEVSGIMFSPLCCTGGEDLGLLVLDALKGKTFSLNDVRLIKKISQLTSAAIQREHQKETAKDEMAKRECLIVLGKISEVMVHSIRNPLTSLGGNARRVKKITESKRGELNKVFGAGKREAFENNIRIVVEEVARIEGIVSSVWDLSRPAVLDLEKCNINHLLEEEVGRYRLSYKERGIIFTTNFDGHLAGVTMMVDKLRLQTCIGDIVSNACDKSTLATKIFIGARLSILPKMQCVITIMDNGVGIEPMDQEDIFEPFMTKNKPGGTGLGLPIAKHIVKGHGGEIKVESNPGRTIFKIFLPLPLPSIK